MLKLDITKSTKEMIASSLVAGLLLLAALVAIFHSFPDNPWAAVFGLLYIANLWGADSATRELREKQRQRREWLIALSQNLGIVAVHRGDRDFYSSDQEFWVAMQKEAREEIENEDGIQAAGADLDGERKPSAIRSLIGSIFSLSLTVALAWWLASLWPRAL